MERFSSPSSFLGPWAPFTPESGPKVRGIGIFSEDEKSRILPLSLPGESYAVLPLQQQERRGVQCRVS